MKNQKRDESEGDYGSLGGRRQQISASPLREQCECERENKQKSGRESTKARGVCLWPSGSHSHRSRGELRYVRDLAVGAGAELLILQAIDRLSDEPHRPVAEAEVRALGVLAAEGHHAGPVARVGRVGEEVERGVATGIVAVGVERGA